MRVFLYEFATGGGRYSLDGEIGRSFATEGAAMLSALAADFAALAGVEVAILHDPRAPLPGAGDYQVHPVATAAGQRLAFGRLARQCDWTVVIAPELDEQLVTRLRWVQQAGGRLLGPPVDLAALLSDKQRTAEHLQQGGVPVPRGRLLGPSDALPADFPYPAVIKPAAGAGSTGVRWVGDARSELATTCGVRRLERFCRGTAASVAVLCGPAGAWPLAPCGQRLSDDGRFSYLGGWLPLPEDLKQRAVALACRAVAAVDYRLGYVGVDLILGRCPNGTEDVVVEINPRLTTSYLGLRVAVRCNLAGAMLQAAAGLRPEIPPPAARVTFTAAGSTTFE